MNYRPITDVWILARPKVAYYGAYPSGFLERARALLGVNCIDPVLHVCAGRVKDYPFGGLGPNDKTLDLDTKLKPDFRRDVRDVRGLPRYPGGWPAILADPPYTVDDAARYRAGARTFPVAADVLARCLDAVRPGGRVGLLHYLWPRPPNWMGKVRCVALIAVICGYDNRMRAFSVFERAKR